jgi:hypothetical protein
MLNDVLSFLKNRLNSHLRTGLGAQEPQEDQVVFLTGQNAETLTLKLGAVSMLLVRMEQEKVLRAPDLYQRTLPDGQQQNVQPEIRLDLYVLLAAHYPQYEDRLRTLSAILRYFQANRLFTPASAPDLNPEIEQLVLELASQSFAEQNEVWGSLRLPYHPSLLYKVKMAVYQADPAPVVATVSDLALGLQRIQGAQG